MKKNIRICRKIIFTAYIMGILLIKLILATGVRIWANCENFYDDGMLIKYAANLIKGNWLGAYNQYTLAKGITFSLYLTLINKIGLPFLFSNVLMCFAASLIFILVIKKFISNRISLAVIYTVLMFNPISTDSWTFQRVYRDSLYSYLVVILFSFIILIYLNKNDKLCKMLWYSIGAGVLLSAVWLAREDSPWVMPFVVIALLITSAFIVFNKEIKQKIKRLLVIAIVPVLLITSVITVSGINYKYYGVFATNEFTGGYLPKLFKALTIIKPDEWMPKVPIPKSTREKAYSVSPTFSKIKPILEKHIFVTSENGNASCSMLAWAIIDSVQTYGLKDGKSSQEFYKDAADEINAAISEGELPTRGGYIFMFESPWDNRYIKPIIKSFGETLRMTIHMSKYKSIPLSDDDNESSGAEISFLNMTMVEGMQLGEKNLKSIGSNTKIKQLENITNNLAYQNSEKIPEYQNKLDIINKISYIYYKLNPIFFIIGIISYIYISLRFVASIRRKRYILFDQWLIITALFLSYILRLLLISYTDVCSIYMKYPMYLAPCYWLLLMAVFTSIFVAGKELFIINSKAKLKGKKF